jgi:hypothetical protein
MPTTEQLFQTLVRTATPEQLEELSRGIQRLLRAIDDVEQSHKVNPVIEEAKEA